MKKAFLVLASFFFVTGFAAYLSYYSEGSRAKTPQCFQNRLCTSNSQCGIGTCTAIYSGASKNGPGKIGKLGKCVCKTPPQIKPTAKPAASWWFNPKSKGMTSCFYSRMPSGMPSTDTKSFETLEDCELSLFASRPDIAKFRCKQRGGIEVSGVTTNPAELSDYHFNFNINKTVACWTKDLNCSLCKGKCVDLASNRCDIKDLPEQATGSAKKTTTGEVGCAEVLGRCAVNFLNTVRPTPTCEKPPEPPAGCRYEYIGDGKIVPGDCPDYELVCGPTSIPVTKVPQPTHCPRPYPPPGCKVRINQTAGLLPTECPSYSVVCEGTTPSPQANPQALCMKAGGVWKTIDGEKGNEGWCFKNSRACEGNAFMKKAAFCNS